jgi:hypothetical protein
MIQHRAASRDDASADAAMTSSFLSVEFKIFVTWIFFPVCIPNIYSFHSPFVRTNQRRQKGSMYFMMTVLSRHQIDDKLMLIKL